LGNDLLNLNLKRISTQVEEARLQKVTESGVVVASQKFHFYNSLSNHCTISSQMDFTSSSTCYYTQAA